MGHSRRSVVAGMVASAATLSQAANAIAAGPLAHHDVKIQSFQFVPDRIEARPGDIIRWTNEDLSPHTATANEFGWDTEELAKGASAELVVTKDMETSYFCAFHPHMKGLIVVL